MTHRFSPELFRFFEDLSDHNDKVWFEENRERYREHVEAPLLSFVERLAAPMAKISDAIRVEAKRTGGSLLRIHRDQRFSKGAPYQTHAAAMFLHRCTPKGPGMVGFYLELGPARCRAGAGISGPPPDQLGKLRAHIAQDVRGWSGVREAMELEGDQLARVPRGFDPEHRFADDLRRKSFYATVPFTHAEVTRVDFVERYAEACRKLAPLARFAMRALDLPW